MAAALESYVSESVAFLIIAGLLAVLLSLAARRLGVPRALGPVRLVARLPLEARRAVYVVRVVDRVLIIGSSEAGLTKLGELPGDALGELPLEHQNTPFARLLDGVWRPKAPHRGEVSPVPPADGHPSRARGPDSEED